MRQIKANIPTEVSIEDSVILTEAIEVVASKYNLPSSDAYIIGNHLLVDDVVHTTHTFTDTRKVRDTTEDDKMAVNLISNLRMARIK